MQYLNLYRTTWYSLYFTVRGTRDCCYWLLSSVKWLHLRSFLYQRILNLNLIFAFPCIRPGSAVWRFCLLKITCTDWYIGELSHSNVSPDNINKGGWGWNGTTGRFSSLSPLLCPELLPEELMKIEVFELFHHADWLTVTGMHPVYLYVRLGMQYVSPVVYWNKEHESKKHDETAMISQQ